jgi:cell division protein FtsI (penicillin-binding protein 3)
MQENQKIISIFLLFFILLLIVFTRYVYVAFDDRDLSRIIDKKRDKAKRGSIITADGYKVALTEKTYTATVNLADIPPANREVFIKMFSIYSDMPAVKVAHKLASKDRGIVTLTTDLNFRQYTNLKKLAVELRTSGLLAGRYNDKKRYNFIGLQVKETGAARKYPYGKTLTPLIGFTNKVLEKEYNKVKGIKGLEARFNEDMKPGKDGYVLGYKDVTGQLILNSKIDKKEREDGSDIYLNIDLSVQVRLEKLLTKKLKEFQAKEILAVVMESRTGNIIALATSNRYTRKTLKDISFLNINAVEYTFEPGSVIKPIIFSLLIEHKQIRRGQYIDCENGRYRIGRKIITDEHKMKIIPVEKVIIESSNIGMSKLVKDFSPLDFYNGLRKFGFGQKTGLEVTRELVGRTNTIKELERHIYRATASYGYGFTVNFIQLLKAYNVFNNDGVMMIPKVVSYIKTGKHISSEVDRISPIDDETRIISVATARKIKNILIRTVKEGTGKSADVPGYEIGGKTGTAHIAEKGGYANRYHASFFGFVNDKKQKYTIGVTVVEPSQRYYFASQSAAPIFKKIVEILIETKYLAQ